MYENLFWKTVRNYHGQVNGSSFMGYLEATREERQEIFGYPSHIEPDPDEKVQIEWIVQIKDDPSEDDLKVCNEMSGTYLTIYNWKCPAPSLNEKYQWHIGGFSKEAELMAQKIFDTCKRDRAATSRIDCGERDNSWRCFNK